MRIFIGGIHAVGKSHLCSIFCLNNNWLHKSSSELIRDYKAQTWANDKQVTDISDNQEVLITAVNEISNDLLLDGHFVLINNKGTFSRIEDEVFHRMNIDGIILIENTAEIIKKRFENRSKSKLDVNIDDFLKIENEHAKQVSLKYNIPLIILHSPNDEDFKKAIEMIK
ncbi:ATP-binding protein [Serratia silvae]|uniref:AAA family ATPase n=1 Tax=Serratia silvae TaxID=2824122 RepID=A0ABT0K966_9GAMM|nr:ATP-binding protein [Serratia silvae]MCL1028566.1 AAA family ATPase [Serratia silvae]